VEYYKGPAGEYEVLQRVITDVLPRLLIALEESYTGNLETAFRPGAPD
jgi:hypothetical protein